MTAEATRLELRLEPGAEGVIRLSIVAPTTLSLSLADVEQEGRYYKVKLRGTQENLPKDATCRVLLKVKSLGEERDSEFGAVPMQLNGKDCTIDFKVDTFASGLFGKGTVQFTVLPDFPFATGCTVPEPLRFDNPVDVNGASPGKVLLGRLLELEPVFSEKFKQATLKLSVFHGGAIASGRISDSLAFSIFEWTAEDDDTKEWRVGCAESGDEYLLTYLDSHRAEYSFDLRLEAIQKTDGHEVSYLVWDRPNAVSFPKPKLTSFTLDSLSTRAEVENVDPSFRLPLELTLWQYGLQNLDPIVQTLLMNPISRPALAESSSSEYFWQLLMPESLLMPGSSMEQVKTFALLRIPRTLSGTEEYVPVSAVMDYDESRFRAFDDDELWLDPPKKSRGTQRSNYLKTRKELATALASEELKDAPTRAPHFGSISTGVRDHKLLVSIKLVGDSGYWKAAEPSFSLYDDDCQTELSKLTTQPSALYPHLLEALIPLNDKNLLGKKVSIRGQVTKPDAHLWDEVVAAPPAFSVPYEGVPRLDTPTQRIVELTDATSYIQVRCQTHHIPNGKWGSILGFRIREYFQGHGEPILLSGIPFRYDIPKGTGGKCDARGRLVARITNQEMVDKLRSEGRYRLEAYVLDKDGKVLSTDVRASSMDFGKSPRRLEGTMVWGQKVSADFRTKVLAICDHLDIHPDHLMACMAFETGRTFSASKQNAAGNRAYGLIQFTDIGAKDLGKTLNELRAMSEIEQLDYVQEYMRRCIKSKGPLKTLGDVYMAILCPAAVGKPETYWCYSKANSPGSYKANAKLDKNKKGYITKADATAKVDEQYREGQLFRM